MTALKETLLKDPYSLALLQQGPEETGDTTEEEELAAPADPDPMNAMTWPCGKRPWRTKPSCAWIMC